MSGPAHGGRRRSAAAAAISIALHAALVLWLATRPASPPRVHRPPMRVELRPAGRPATPPTPVPAVLGTRGTGRPGVAPGEVAATGSAGAAPGELGPGSPDTLTGWLRAPSLGAHPLAPSIPGEIARPDAPRTPQQTVHDLLESMRAEDLRRYPDASWTDLRDALANGFAPPMSSLERQRALGVGPGAGPGLLGRFLDGYGKSAERYGRTGSVIEPGPGAPGDHDSTRENARQVAVAGSIGNKEREAAAPAFDALATLPGPNAPMEVSGALVTVVAVALDAEGAVKSVRLVSRSGSPAYDRAVLDRAEQVVGRRLSRRLAGTITEWAFATEVRIQPMTPGLGLSFDDAFKPKDVHYPLQRVVRTRVELRSVRPG